MYSYTRGWIVFWWKRKKVPKLSVSEEERGVIEDTRNTKSGHDVRPYLWVPIHRYVHSCIYTYRVYIKYTYIRIYL